MAGIRLGGREYYASDYFGKLYDFAVDLIKRLAYVDDQPAAVISSQGTPTQPVLRVLSAECPEENLDLFERMNHGEFEEGSRVLKRDRHGIPTCICAIPLFTG